MQLRCAKHRYVGESVKITPCDNHQLYITVVPPFQTISNDRDDEAVGGNGLV